MKEGRIDRLGRLAIWAPAALFVLLVMPLVFGQPVWAAGMGRLYGQVEEMPTPAEREKVTALGKEIMRLYSEIVDAKTPEEKKKATNELVELLIENVLTGDTFSRHMAIGGMHDIDDPRLVPCLIVALTDDNPRVRVEAADKLYALGDSRAVEALIGVVTGDKDPDAREAAADALAVIRDARAIEAFVLALKDSSREMRQSAVSVLGDIGDKRAIDPLKAALNDEDERVRNAVPNALRRIREANDVDFLLERLAAHRSHRRYNTFGPPAELRFVIALERVRDERAVEPLIEVLEDEDWRIRGRAAQGLAGKEDPRAAAALLGAAKEKRLLIVAGGHEWLIRNGDPDTQDVLIAALNEWGDVGIVRNYLYCGNAALAKAARNYAEKNEHVGPLPEAPKDPIRWGSLRGNDAD